MENNFENNIRNARPYLRPRVNTPLNIQHTNINDVMLEYQHTMREYQTNMYYYLINQNQNTNNNQRQNNVFSYIINPVETQPLNNSQQTNDIFQTFLTELMRDVIVRPTEEQINNATELRYYSSELHITERCPISLENFIENEEICAIKHCGHIFKKEPIKEWFRTSVKCPVCRYDIRTYNISTNPYSDNVERQNQINP